MSHGAGVAISCRVVSISIEMEDVIVTRQQRFILSLIVVLALAVVAALAIVCQSPVALVSAVVAALVLVLAIIIPWHGILAISREGARIERQDKK